LCVLEDDGVYKLDYKKIDYKSAMSKLWLDRRILKHTKESFNCNNKPLFSLDKSQKK
jgi:hypothetical protein